MFGKLKTKSDFFAGKMLLCDMPFSSIFLLNNHERSGSWPHMFFVVVGTHTKCIINEFALDVRIDILIFQCHTVTNGIDLRRSPQGLLWMILQASPELAHTFRDDQALQGHHLLRPLGEWVVLADVQVPRHDRSRECILHHPHPLCCL